MKTTIEIKRQFCIIISSKQQQQKNVQIKYCFASNEN